MGLEFIELLDDSGFYKVRGGNVCNMDVTTTTRRTKTVRTLGRKGRYVTF